MSIKNKTDNPADLIPPDSIETTLFRKSTSDPEEIINDSKTIDVGGILDATYNNISVLTDRKNARSVFLSYIDAKNEFMSAERKGNNTLRRKRIGYIIREIIQAKKDAFYMKIEGYHQTKLLANEEKVVKTSIVQQQKMDKQINKYAVRQRALLNGEKSGRFHFPKFGRKKLYAITQTGMSDLKYLRNNPSNAFLNKYIDHITM